MRLVTTGKMIVKIFEIVPSSHYKPALSWRRWRQGKSGQRRATYRLTAGCYCKMTRESATENNCPPKVDEGENVR